MAMQLTAELYHQIVRALRSDKRTIQDRRRYPRVGLRAKINIIPLDSRRKPMEAQCVWERDVSAGGFGTGGRKKLQPRAPFTPTLARAAPKPPSRSCDAS